MATTKIQWTNRVWNPITGCTKISAGCAHCYAERMAKRLAGRCGYPEAPDQFKVTLHPEKLLEPRKWRKPCMIFVDSMGDLFHKDVPDEYIGRVFAQMAISQRHTFQILTKRAERLPQWFDWMERKMKNSVWPAAMWPLPNVWLGISAENQQCADERIPLLLKTPAAVRFVSVEPMLGPVNLAPYLPTKLPDGTPIFSYRQGLKVGLDWVIIGCESGPRARPLNIDWVRDLRDQCVAAHVPLFIKQLEQIDRLVKLPYLDGHQWTQFPEVAHV